LFAVTGSKTRTFYNINQRLPHSGSLLNFHSITPNVPADEPDNNRYNEMQFLQHKTVLVINCLVTKEVGVTHFQELSQNCVKTTIRFNVSVCPPAIKQLDSSWKEFNEN
jgi:hypothetical protein